MGRIEGNKMNRGLIKKIVVLITVLAMIIPLFGYESVYAATMQFAINNMVNIQVYDQHGNKINTGKLFIYNERGSSYATVTLSTGELMEWADVYKMGEAAWLNQSYFQKYVTEGTIMGISQINTPYLNYTFLMDSSVRKMRLWYQANHTDYTLAANQVGLYVDPAWKNATSTSITIGSKTIVPKNSTGLTLYNLSSGNYKGTINIGDSGASYSELVSSSTKTEYVKKRIKLSDLSSSSYSSDGYYTGNGGKIKIGSSDANSIAQLVFISKGMITIPVPDSQGYVEVYVEKTSGELSYTYKFRNGLATGGGGAGITGYLYKDIDIQMMAAPTEGYSLMGMEAGKYIVDINTYNTDYAKIDDQPIEIKSSDSIQYLKFIVHKHDYTGDWQSSSSSHWKACNEGCSERRETASHTYGSWVVDVAATEQAEGKQHRNCTVCGYEQTKSIPKLSHTHKFATTWSYDRSAHWYLCSCGAKNSYNAHSYNWIVDKEATVDEAGSKHQQCSVCGYEKDPVEIPKLHKHEYSSQWIVDNEGHWQECSCGDKQNYKEHSSSKEATETDAKICDTCEYIMEPATGHIKHSEDNSKLLKDEVSHWYGCVGCNKKMSESKHTFKWVIDWEATEDITGQKHEECNACGYKKAAVEIPKIVIETESETKPLDVPNENIESDPGMEIETESKDITDSEMTTSGEILGAEENIEEGTASQENNTIETSIEEKTSAIEETSADKKLEKDNQGIGKWIIILVGVGCVIAGGIIFAIVYFKKKSKQTGSLK